MAFSPAPDWRNNLAFTPSYKPIDNSFTLDPVLTKFTVPKTTPPKL